MKSFLRTVFSTRTGVALFVSTLSTLSFWLSRLLSNPESFFLEIKGNLLIGVMGGICIALFVYAFVRIEKIEE